MASGKLTTIVVVDVDGFSAMAEADEAAAIAAVARLGERCAKIAEHHNGRIFNTSGDSLMMEFANAFGAVHAALEVAAVADPPVRVAVHTGEVSPMPTGDLLGRGVSVAARLQSHARPGVIIVSEDTRKALRGPLAEKLVSKGAVKLDKMDENIGIHELPVDANAGARRPLSRKQMIWIAAGGALAVIVLALVSWPLLNRDQPPRVAVLSFTTLQDAALQGIAEGVAEDASAALRARGIDALARDSSRDTPREQALDGARGAGALFALEGSIEREQDTVRITIGVARTSDHAVLWSDTIEGTAAAAPALRQVAAGRGVSALACAVRAGATAPADAYPLLLGACAHAENRDARGRNVEALSQAVAQAPDLGVARAMLAAETAALLETASEPQRQELRAEIHANAERALRQDRSLGEAYLALERIEPRRRWDARERTLQQGLDHNERNGALSSEYSELLFEVGRFDDALAYARNASTLEPLSLSKRAIVGSILLQNGDIESARDIVDELSEVWPNDANLWLLRLRVAFWGETYDDALALINAPASQIRSTRARQCWRHAVDAMRSAPNTLPRTAALRQIVDCSNTGDLPTAQALMQYSALGELDEAFALARQRFEDERRGGEEVLFSAATAPMRHDPRFMPLMRDLGLLGYWRLSGHWPDFCRDPSLPYRCQAEAQRLR